MSAYAVIKRYSTNEKNIRSIVLLTTDLKYAMGRCDAYNSDPANTNHGVETFDVVEVGNGGRIDLGNESTMRLLFAVRLKKKGEEEKAVEETIKEEPESSDISSDETLDENEEDTADEDGTNEETTVEESSDISNEESNDETKDTYFDSNEYELDFDGSIEMTRMILDSSGVPEIDDCFATLSESRTMFITVVDYMVFTGVVARLALAYGVENSGADHAKFNPIVAFLNAAWEEYKRSVRMKLMDDTVALVDAKYLDPWKMWGKDGGWNDVVPESGEHTENSGADEATEVPEVVTENSDISEAVTAADDSNEYESEAFVNTDSETNGEILAKQD